MHKEIIVNVSPNEVRVGLMEDRQLAEVAMERADSKRVVGNVYKGVVTAVRPGLQAAFVDIGMEKAGFLHVSDLVHDESKDDDHRASGGRRTVRRGRGRENMRSIETMLREGDEILVQVTKEVIGTKGPRITADISLPGRFLVMMPMGSHVGVSRKIDDRRERGRLRDLLAQLKPPGPGAYIIRTAGSGINEKMLERDMEYLSGLWKAVGENAKLQPAPSLVHEDVGMIVGLVRDIFKEDVDALHLDDKAEYERLMNYLKAFAPEMKNRVHLYKGTTPIFDKFGIENEIKKSLDKKVWMNRGGFLVIEQTEALISIDVNTGRYTGKKNQEETILRTNMAAAREIPRQLRLRDIGGIIVIDFIDMESEADKRRVFNELRNGLRYDRARHKTFQISDLGLIEMSRQRVRESLRDQLSDDCIFCRGSGKVLSVETLGNKVERFLEKVPLVSNDSAIQVQASPTLALVLQTDRAESVRQIARQNGLKISVVDDPRLHREEFKIIALESRQDLVATLEEGGRGEGRRRHPEPAIQASSPSVERDRERGSRREASRRGGTRGRGRGGRRDEASAPRDEAPTRREEAPARREPRAASPEREDRRRESQASRRPAPSAPSTPSTPSAAEGRPDEANGDQSTRRRRRRGRRGRGGGGSRERSETASNSEVMRQPDPSGGAASESPERREASPSPEGRGDSQREDSDRPRRSRGGRRRGSRGRGGSRAANGDRPEATETPSVEPRSASAPVREEAPEAAPVSTNAEELSSTRKPPERRSRRRVRRSGSSGSGSSSGSKEAAASPPEREAPAPVAQSQPTPPPAPSPVTPAAPVDGSSTESRPRARRRQRRTRRTTSSSGSKGDDSSKAEPEAVGALLRADAANASDSDD